MDASAEPVTAAACKREGTDATQRSFSEELAVTTEQASKPVRRAKAALSDVLSVSAAQGVAMVLALVSVTIVTHLLVPAQYAILAYIGVISGLMLAGTTAWTGTAVIRYGREELERHGSVRATNWGRLVIMAPLVAVAAALIVGLKLAGALPQVLTWPFVAIAIATGIAAVLTSHVITLLEACGRMRLTALGLSLQRAFSIAGVLVLIALGLGHSPAAIALTWLITASVLTATLAAVVWRLGFWPPAIDRQHLRRMLALSLPLIAFTISQYVIGTIDIVILGAYRGPRQVGLYAIAYQGYGMLQQIANTASIVLSPLFVSLRLASREEMIRRYYQRIAPQAVFVCSVGVGLVVPLMGVVVETVFGHAFASSSAPLAILLFAWVFFAAESSVAAILVLHERARAIATINLVAAIVNVIGDWFLVGVLGVGIIAPAIVTVASVAIIAVGYFRVAAGCVAVRSGLPIVMVLPALLSVALDLGLGGIAGALTAVSATLIAAALILRWRRPFAPGDIKLMEKLELPRPVKNVMMRTLARLV